MAAQHQPKAHEIRDMFFVDAFTLEISVSINKPVALNVTHLKKYLKDLLSSAGGRPSTSIYLENEHNKRLSMTRIYIMYILQ